MTQSSNKEDHKENFPAGIYTRVDKKEHKQEVEVSRPSGMSYPVAVTVHWKTPVQGREALNRLMDELMILEVDHAARAVVRGETYEIAALSTLGNRSASTLISKLKNQPDKFSLERKDEKQKEEGFRLDLLLSFELLLRCALWPFKDAVEIPSWVKRARLVYPELEKTLQGEPLFQPESTTES